MLYNPIEVLFRQIPLRVIKISIYYHLILFTLVTYNYLKMMHHWYKTLSHNIKKKKKIIIILAYAIYNANVLAYSRHHDNRSMLHKLHHHYTAEIRVLSIIIQCAPRSRT